MKKTAIILMFITLISKLIGFGRELFLSYYYGTSSISDAYIISLTISSIIIGFIIQSIVSIYIPQYSKIELLESEEFANKYTSNIINTINILLSILIVITLVFTKQLVNLFASGFDAETTLLAVKFTRVTVFSIYFTFMTRVFSSYLNVKNCFIIPTVIGIPYSIILIISIILSSRYSIIYLPLGMLFSSVIQLLILIPSIIKTKYKHKIIINVKDKYLKEMMVLSIPVLLGLSVNQINVLVDRTLASKIVEGGITSLMYARYLNDFVIAVFILPIITIAFPQSSKLFSENNLEGIKHIINESIIIIILILIPASVGFIIFSEEIVKLVYFRGSFNEKSVLLTSSALLFYSIGMIGSSFRAFFLKIYFAMGDTKTPNVTAIISLIVNIILNIILSKYFGIGGLALSTSIASFLSSFIMMKLLTNKFNKLYSRVLFVKLIKVVVSTLGMAYVSRLTYDTLVKFQSNNIVLIPSIFIGAAIYIFMLYVLRLEEIKECIEKIKNFIIKNRKDV